MYVSLFQFERQSHCREGPGGDGGLNVSKYQVSYVVGLVFSFTKHPLIPLDDVLGETRATSFPTF